ncbi:MAG: aminotransferase class I/II-fold pyridoxal phosphate-dependent enzyme, partial [Gaiellaceae bacterium]
REALASADAGKLGRLPDAKTEVFVTLGATHGLLLGMMAILDRGDEVLIPDPGFPPYRGMVTLAGGRSVPYRLPASADFEFDPDAVRAAVTDRTRAIILNSPSNPTGRVASSEFLSAVADLAQKRNLWVLSDDVYERIIFDGRVHQSIAGLAEMQERTIVVSAFSKTYAMTGWRLGHVVAPANVVATMAKLQGHVNACASPFTQQAGITALRMDQGVVDEYVRHYERRREVCMSAFAGVPAVRCVRPEGSFFILCDIRSTGRNDVELSRELLYDARVSSVPGSGFGCESDGFLRFSLACATDQLEEAMQRVCATLASAHHR